MRRRRSRGNCNLPDTCQVEAVSALDLLAGQTSQCDPQVLEPNAPALICDTPAGIQSLQGSDAQPIILTQLSELADAGQAILIKEPNGRIRALVAPNGVDFGVPVYQAGAVSVKDLAFALQNFNVSSIGNVGNCNFSLAVWSKCNDGSSIISLKQMSFADFTVAIANALLADPDFINAIDNCANLSQVTTLTSVTGCLNGTKGQLLAGNGPRELAGYNGVWNNIARGMGFYPSPAQILSVGSTGSFPVNMPSYPAAIPNGAAWGCFQTLVIITSAGGRADVVLNNVRLNHTEAPSGAEIASYQFMIAPVGSIGTFVCSTPNSATFNTQVELLGYLA